MTENVLPESNLLSAGQILKAARLEQGLKLEQIAKNLFIRTRQLSLLENDLEEEGDHLVCDVYTLGFVRLYAQHLNLNAQEIVDAFKEKHAEQLNNAQPFFPAPLPGRGMPSFPVLAFSLLVFAGIIIGWEWANKDTVPPFPPELVLDTTPSTLPEESLSPEPLDTLNPDFELTDFILETNNPRGEYPLFEKRVLKVEHNKDNRLSPSEKWLE